MLLVQSNELGVLVTNQDVADVPPAADGGEEGTGYVRERREVAAPCQDADGSNQKLHGNGRPREQERPHGWQSPRKSQKARGRLKQSRRS